MQKVRIQGTCIGKANLEDAQVRVKGKNIGLLALTEPLHDKFTTVQVLLSETLGADMNVDAGFSGVPEIIHNGTTSAEWDATGPATWDFSTGGVITLTSGNNNDVATFSEETPTTVDVSTFVALTGQIDLNTYNPVLQDFTIQFDLAGVLVGDAITLNQFIQTGDFTAQQFNIPLSTFNFQSNLVDGFTITVNRSGGTKPIVVFDNIQLEKTQTASSFIYRPTIDEVQKLVSLKIIMADDVTAESAFNALFGVSALANGITVTATSLGKSVFGGTFTQLIDFLSISRAHYESSVGAATSWLTVEIPFTGHNVILSGLKEDTITFTINDDLSALSFFRVFVTVTKDV